MASKEITKLSPHTEALPRISDLYFKPSLKKTVVDQSASEIKKNNECETKKIDPNVFVPVNTFSLPQHVKGVRLKKATKAYRNQLILRKIPISGTRRVNFADLVEERRMKKTRIFVFSLTAAATAIALSTVITPVSIVYSHEQSWTDSSAIQEDNYGRIWELFIILNKAKDQIEKAGFVSTYNNAMFVSATDINLDNWQDYINIPDLTEAPEVQKTVKAVKSNENGTSIELTVELGLEEQILEAKINLGGFLDCTKDQDLILDFFLDTQPLFKGDPLQTLASSINSTNLDSLFTNLPTPHNLYKIELNVENLHGNDRLGILNITYTGTISRGNGYTTTVKHIYVISGFQIID